MRHVTRVLAPVFALVLAAPAAAGTIEPEGPVLRILESPLNLGPYSDPNG